MTANTDTNFVLEKAMKDTASCLLVVDMQPDFYETGALPVPGGSEIVEPIARLTREFSNVVFTQDSHPEGHISFASSYISKKPFESLKIEELEAELSISSYFSAAELKQYLASVEGGAQTLWPDHCVVGTKGWELDPRLDLNRGLCILRKGLRAGVDSYSGFKENDGSSTGLTGLLKERGIRRVFVCGLAGDYCVFWTAKDAKAAGFEVFLLEGLTRFVGFPEGSIENALKVMDELGIVRL